MATPTIEQLSSILTPSLFRQVVKGRFPWSKEETLDFTKVKNYYFGGEFDSEKFQQICVPALKALSVYDVEKSPDLMQLLPVPEKDEFPEQAFGLLLLLDQGPRHSLGGVDQRYTNSFFDPLALKLARDLYALPPSARPDSKERWEKLGYSFGHWVVAKFWFIAPLAHSETYSDQEMLIQIVDDLRNQVEKETGTTDPYREEREQITTDPTLFSTRAMQDWPSKSEYTIADITFWFGMIMDTHLPIIKTFARFPYRNGTVGRDTTEAEKVFLETTNNFGCVDEESAVKIRQDVDAGRWSPLSGPL